MPNRLKRASFARLAVGLAVLAFPLVATSVAQAAIAGALPSNTTIHPDIRSATINPTLGDTGASVCFNKPLNGSFVPGEFVIGGYRAGNLQDAVAAATDPTNTNCVLVTWPASIGDINQYTFVEVNAGAVRANAGSVPNLLDSVGLTGSISRAGVTGLTVAPNLAGVLPPTGGNQVSHSLTYVFDKSTNSAASTNTGFFFETQAGIVCTGLPAQAPLSGNGSTTLTIVFNDGPCGGVVNAIRAGLFTKTVTATSDAAATNPNESVIMPNCNTGTNCPTSVPDLVSASLNSNNDSITYNFDKNVTIFPPNLPSDFLAEMATGQTLPSTSAVCSGMTCTAQFNGTLANQAEFGVLAWVSGVAVHAADNPAVNNLPGAAKIGDNAGAFSRAFTTGPDVFGVTMNKTTGQVQVNLDDRVGGASAVNPANIHLLAGDGGVIAATPSPSFNSSAGPGPQTVTLTYPASVLTNATQLQFLGCPGGACGSAAAFTEPMTSFVSPFDAKNISQIVSSVNSGAIVRAYNMRKAAIERAIKHAKRYSAHKHKRNKRH